MGEGRGEGSWGGGLAGAILSAVVFGLVIFGAAAEDSANVDDLAWLAGCWADVGDSQRVEECWLTPRGGMMLGLNRTARDDGRGAFEYLRIAPDEDGIVTYFASPSAKPATPFRLMSHGPRQATFENPDHDFPQRIIYRIGDDGVLRIRVEAEADGQTRGFELVLSPAEFP